MDAICYLGFHLGRQWKPLKDFQLGDDLVPFLNFLILMPCFVLLFSFLLPAPHQTVRILKTRLGHNHSRVLVPCTAGRRHSEMESIAYMSSAATTIKTTIILFSISCITGLL